MKKTIKCSISIKANNEFHVKSIHQRPIKDLSLKWKRNQNDNKKKSTLFHQLILKKRRNYTRDVQLSAINKDNNTEYPVITTGFIRPQGRKVQNNELEKNENIEFGIASARGYRESMEDEALVFPNGQGGYLYSMVLDGHDGLPAVQWLADHLFDIVSDCMEKCKLKIKNNSKELNSLLKDSFLEADKELLKYLKESGGGIQAAKSGSTATVALVRRDRLVVANVGDSRLVLCRNNVPVDLTTEHRVYGRSKSVDAEKARVKEIGGWIEDGRVCGLLAVSRAFGDWELKGEGLPYFLQNGIEEGYWDAEFVKTVEFKGDPVVSMPDVTDLELTPDDNFIIIATDGMWDVMSSTDAVRYVQSYLKKEYSVQEIANMLVDLSIKRHTTDNVAVIIIDLEGKENRKIKLNKQTKQRWTFG